MIHFKDKHIKNRYLGLLLIALLLIVVLIAMIGATYAIFTSSRSAQRTIAAYDTEGQRFSSNYLLTGDSRDNVRTIYTTDVRLSAIAAVSVCNYQQGRETLPYDRDISYTLTARLVRYDESTLEKYVEADAAYLAENSLTEYQVSISDGSVTKTLTSSRRSDSFSGSLTGGTANSHAYTVTFSTNFGANKPNLYVELIATPSNSNLAALRGVFKPDFRVAGATDYWEGSYRDDTSVSPSSYDGYNYQITGMGSGNVTISWDSTKVTLSDVSHDLLLAVEGATQSGSSITLPVDSDLQSRYEIQFYNTGVTNETWEQMTTDVVTFEFE